MQLKGPPRPDADAGDEARPSRRDSRRLQATRPLSSVGMCSLLYFKSNACSRESGFFTDAPAHVISVLYGCTGSLLGSIHSAELLKTNDKFRVSAFYYYTVWIVKADLHQPPGYLPAF